MSYSYRVCAVIEDKIFCFGRTLLCRGTTQDEVKILLSCLVTITVARDSKRVMCGYECTYVCVCVCGGGGEVEGGEDGA